MTADGGAPFLVQTETVLDGRAAIVRLARPGGLNPLNGVLLDALDAALDDMAARPDLRVMVLTGSDKSFSVGADLKEPLTDVGQRVARMHAMVERLATFPALSIAAIEGWALGGGLELAMACDFRAAAPDAKLGLPEVGLGVIPSYGGTQLTPRLIGPARALELLCLGEPIDAQRAERIGLVNWVAGQPGGALALALDRAAVLAKHQKAALLAARQSLREGEGLTLSEALAVEARVSAALTSNTSEATAEAFRSQSTSR